MLYMNSASQLMTASGPARLDPQIRFKDVLKARGVGETRHLADIRAGLYTPSIRVGNRWSFWPESEVIALNAVRVADWPDEQIRELVKRLLAKRKAAADGLFEQLADKPQAPSQPSAPTRSWQSRKAGG